MTAVFADYFPGLTSWQKRFEARPDQGYGYHWWVQHFGSDTFDVEAVFLSDATYRYAFSFVDDTLTAQVAGPDGPLTRFEGHAQP